MRRRTAVRGVVAAVAAAASLGLAGCGSEDSDDPYAIPERFQDYCDEVSEQQVVLGEALASGGETSGLIAALPIFETLAAEAPDDISDDWDVVIDRISDLVAALDAADVDPDTYDRRQPPAGLTREQKGAIDAAARALVSRATASAMGSVQQHARDVCKTPLTL